MTNEKLAALLDEIVCDLEAYLSGDLTGFNLQETCHLARVARALADGEEAV